jgi:hypothetical protein
LECHQNKQQNSENFEFDPNHVRIKCIFVGHFVICCGKSNINLFYIGKKNDRQQMVKGYDQILSIKYISSNNFHRSLE